MKQFKVSTDKSYEGKSKMQYFIEGKETWQPNKRASYMNMLTRKQTSLIFKARTRMMKVKSNYKNGHTNLKCRMCKNEEETQAHILENCPSMHPDDTLKVTKPELFSSDTGTLREVATKIDKLLKELSDVMY